MALSTPYVSNQGFLQSMALLTEGYRQTATDGLLAAFWAVVGDRPGGEIREAADALLATSKFMPSPAELLAECRRVRDAKASDLREAEQAVARIEEKATPAATWNAVTQYRRRCYRLKNAGAHEKWGDIWERDRFGGVRTDRATEMCDDERRAIEAVGTPPLFHAVEEPE